MEKEDTTPAYMIFKNDEGWWKIVSELGTSINNYSTYESAVLSLPKDLQEGLI